MADASLQDRHDSETQTKHYRLLGRKLQLPDGSRAVLLAVADTPRGRWLNLRPGGWTPEHELMDRDG